MLEIKSLLAAKIKEEFEKKKKEKEEFDALPEEEKKKQAQGVFTALIEKVMGFKKKLGDFKRGIAFFAYDGKCFKDLENQFAPLGGKRKPPSSTRKNIILAIKVMIGMGLAWNIGKSSLDKLGTEKS